MSQSFFPFIAFMPVRQSMYGQGIDIGRKAILCLFSRFSVEDKIQDAFIAILLRKHFQSRRFSGPGAGINTDDSPCGF